MTLPPIRPTLFFLHALGSSRHAFDETAKLLSTFHVVSIDLPGFGDAAPTGTRINETVNYMVRIVAASKATQWMLIGHSMGGKIASIVASRTLQGEPGLFGLRGVVLLAASPPSPEPMEETRRETMIDWMRAGTLDDIAAEEFINANTGAALVPVTHALALHDLRRTSREGWLAWLERGSREDWSSSVGTLDLPALIVAGGADGDLGAEGQRETNARVYPRAQMIVFEGAGHLLPLERPAEIAEAITQFWDEHANMGPPVTESYARLIASDRVSRRTRGILANRALSDVLKYTPQALSPDALTTLRAIAARVVPQDGAAIDLAARLDRQLASGAGDGWRFADLPPDVDAYTKALHELSVFVAMETQAQDAMLARIAEGEWQPRVLSAVQMQHWFEDLRTDLVRLWLAHPATMACIGFDGFANGGDGERKQGFTRLAAGEREGWEPEMKGPIR